jgi:Peptidase family M28
MSGRVLLFVALAVAGGCAREPGLFVEANARAHVGMLADTIGSRPVGSPANLRARTYIIEQLRQIGLEVRVQETDARRHELGTTARVANIIAVLPGERPEAIALVTHYDSSPDAPGATDSALGVGVALEAARLFSAHPRRWTLFVLITDGEESGLLGAAGLVTDRAVTDRLQAYINLESIGSSGTPVLFETGPANAWIVSPWARRAPHPRGGSYALEIYRRLPNDTDFSILKTRDVPGLNFAPIGDSYAYHTARDTVDRLSHATIRSFGENVMAILTALQNVDITRRSDRTATYFDIGGTVAVSYGPLTHSITAALALLLGIVASARLTTDAIRQSGVGRWLLTLVWAWLGVAVTAGAMVGATWLLRAAREVYHPWYARPGWLFVFLLLVGATVAWSMVRIGQWLPRRAHPARQLALAWSATLPGWIVLAGLALWFAPAAAYLWVWPLLTAGLLLSIVPPRIDAAVRVASLVILAVSASLWLGETYDLLYFVVAVMGRMSAITPAATYAAILTASGIMIAPPLIGLLASARPLFRPWLVTAILLLGCVAAGSAAYTATAYTREQPLRRFIRVLQDGGAQTATWEVASLEPGLDLPESAPGTWTPTSSSVQASVPWGRSALPFVFRARGPALGPAPIAISAFSITPLPDGVQLTLSVVPREPGAAVSFVLPAGVVPARSNFPGLERLGRWTARFVAPPAEGIAWQASFHDVLPDQLNHTHILVTSSRLPGGSGWQSLPEGIPQDGSVWSATATWIVPATSGPPIAPVPPLR